MKKKKKHRGAYRNIPEYDAVMAERRVGFFVFCLEQAYVLQYALAYCTEWGGVVRFAYFHVRESDARGGFVGHDTREGPSFPLPTEPKNAMTIYILYMYYRYDVVLVPQIRRTGCLRFRVCSVLFLHAYFDTKLVEFVLKISKFMISRSYLTFSV